MIKQEWGEEEGKPSRIKGIFECVCGFFFPFPSPFLKKQRKFGFSLGRYCCRIFHVKTEKESEMRGKLSSGPW